MYVFVRFWLLVKLLTFVLCYNEVTLGGTTWQKSKLLGKPYLKNQWIPVGINSPTTCATLFYAIATDVTTRTRKMRTPLVAGLCAAPETMSKDNLAVCGGTRRLDGPIYDFFCESAPSWA